MEEEKSADLRMTLDQLDAEAAVSAVVRSVGGQGALRQHLLDMGVLPGVRIEFVKRAPMGDPVEFRIRGYELTLRRADAQQVEIEPDSVVSGAATSPLGDSSRHARNSKSSSDSSWSRRIILVRSSTQSAATCLLNQGSIVSRYRE